MTGFFSQRYVVGQAITFKEDLSNMGLTPSFIATLQWRWDFGDGGRPAESPPTHTFTKPGKYTVFSQVNSNGSVGLTTSTAHTHRDRRRPVHASRCSSPHRAPSSPTPTRRSSSTPAARARLTAHPLTYYWNFADYTTSTDTARFHPFSAYLVSQAPSLTSVVTLIVTDKNTGAQTVKYFDIEVVQQLPTVTLTTSTSSASTGDNITFTAVVTTPATPTPTDGSGSPPASSTLQASTPSKYVWTFGDGATKTTTTPSITRPYTKDGTFNVTLQVLD